MPSVDATVTTRPRLRSRYGSAARTTAAVPSRLTITTRSQSAPSMSPRSPHASVPAAVTTASRPPCSSAISRTAASVPRASERSCSRKAKPLGGGRRSSTTGVPPSASTAAATAAPRPEAPPVTITVPSGSAGRADSYARVDSFGRVSAGTGDLDQPARRAARDVRHDDRAPAPLRKRLRLGQVGDRIVAALRPDMRAQLAEDGAGVVLLEDRDGVDAAQRREHRGAVGHGDDGAVRALEAADGVVRVQAHDQAVAERAGGL